MKYSSKYFLSILMLLVFITLQAQQILTKGDIIVKTAKSPHEGRVVLKEIENLRDDTVVLSIINEFEKPGKQESLKELKPKQKANWDVTFNIIKARLKKTDTSIEIFRLGDNEIVEGNRKESDDIKRSNGNDAKSAKSEISENKAKAMKTGNENIIPDFHEYLNSIKIFSDSTLLADSIAVSSHIVNLNLSSINKSVYIEECIKGYVAGYIDSLKKYTNDSSLIVDKYLVSRGKIENIESSKKLLSAYYRDMIVRKATIIEPLKKIIDDDKSIQYDGRNLKLTIVSVCLLLLCTVLALWFWRANKKSSNKEKKSSASSSTDDNEPSLVVVGPKSMTSLKKQSLDDVYGNEDFIKIDTSDFCDDSLVRCIYIKNSCVKDIYNMYAEDLRNPDNPKEDGCMVLGRWVYDEEYEKYDISLEHIVLPGDDAVFAEYELNFGGKVKLRMSEKLRKLRKETDLQYDLTCWVHSHPGLGVFFSNSDNNVHLQLKHPTHSGFLTAIVIDILTPQQDLGIFTFKDVNTVNSKSDLKKMYSLEALYNRALQNERKSFDSSNYFDILNDAKSHLDSCYGIQLDNSAIIDMTFMTSKPNGFIGYAHGYTLKRGDRTQCVISVINGNESSPNTDKLGCFVVAAHCSIPSIRKIVSRYLHDIHFVLVYTASDGLLTAIPVLDRDLSSSDIYYGEQELDNLKIWTRRRR